MEQAQSPQNYSAILKRMGVRVWSFRIISFKWRGQEARFWFEGVGTSSDHLHPWNTIKACEKKVLPLLRRPFFRMILTLQVFLFELFHLLPEVIPGCWLYREVDNKNNKRFRFCQKRQLATSAQQKVQKLRGSRCWWHPSRVLTQPIGFSHQHSKAFKANNKDNSWTNWFKESHAKGQVASFFLSPHLLEMLRKVGVQNHPPNYEECCRCAKRPTKRSLAPSPLEVCKPTVQENINKNKHYDRKIKPQAEESRWKEHVFEKQKIKQNTIFLKAPTQPDQHNDGGLTSTLLMTCCRKDWLSELSQSCGRPKALHLIFAELRGLGCFGIFANISVSAFHGIFEVLGFIGPHLCCFCPLHPQTSVIQDVGALGSEYCEQDGAVHHLQDLTKAS